MTEIPRLELSELNEMHPRLCLLESFGAATIYRLKIDPTSIASDAKERPLEVTHRNDSKSVVVGWSDLPELITSAVERIGYTENEQTITERAAIGILALLVNRLEGIVIESVSLIGSGGDYFIYCNAKNAATMVECSGIRIDETGTLSRSRLKVKGKQVLSRGADAGFASVTAFRYGRERIVHSYLDYFEQKSIHRNKRTRRK